MSAARNAIAVVLLVLVAAPFAEAWIANVGTVGLGFGAAPSVCGLNKGGQQLYTEVVSRARVGEHSAVQRGVLGLRGAISEKEDDMTLQVPNKRTRVKNFIVSVSSRSWHFVKKRLTIGAKVWDFILGDINDDVPKITAAGTTTKKSTKTIVSSAEDRERLRQLTSTMSLLTRASLIDVQRELDRDAILHPPTPKISPPAGPLDEVDDFLEKHLADEPELRAAVDSVVTSVVVEGIDDVPGGGLKAKVVMSEGSSSASSGAKTTVLPKTEKKAKREADATMIQP